MRASQAAGSGHVSRPKAAQRPGATQSRGQKTAWLSKGFDCLGYKHKRGHGRDETVIPFEKAIAWVCTEGLLRFA